MRRQYLGDALDYWKGGLLAVLRSSSATRLKILPMFTDKWSVEEVGTYARLLGAQHEDVLTSRLFTNVNRKTYFAALARDEIDVFVDPDTGIAPQSRTKATHVTSDELRSLLGPANVVAAYQHRPREGRASGWLKPHMARCGPDLHLIGYESAQVGMIFASRSPERSQKLGRALDENVGAVATARIFQLQPASR